MGNINNFYCGGMDSAFALVSHVWTGPYSHVFVTKLIVDMIVLYLIADIVKKTCYVLDIVEGKGLKKYRNFLKINWVLKNKIAVDWA